MKKFKMRLKAQLRMKSVQMLQLKNYSDYQFIFHGKHDSTRMLGCIPNNRKQDHTDKRYRYVPWDWGTLR